MSEEYQYFNNRHQHRGRGYRGSWQPRMRGNCNNFHWKSYNRFNNGHDSNYSHHPPPPLPPAFIYNRHQRPNFFKMPFKIAPPPPPPPSSPPPGSEEAQQRLIEKTSALIKKQLENPEDVEYRAIAEAIPATTSTGRVAPPVPNNNYSRPISNQHTEKKQHVMSESPKRMKSPNIDPNEVAKKVFSLMSQFGSNTPKIKNIINSETKYDELLRRVNFPHIQQSSKMLREYYDAERYDENSACRNAIVANENVNFEDLPREFVNQLCLTTQTDLQEMSDIVSTAKVKDECNYINNDDVLDVDAESDTKSIGLDYVVFKPFVNESPEADRLNDFQEANSVCSSSLVETTQALVLNSNNVQVECDRAVISESTSLLSPKAGTCFGPQESCGFVLPNLRESDSTNPRLHSKPLLPPPMPPLSLQADDTDSQYKFYQNLPGLHHSTSIPRSEPNRPEVPVLNNFESDAFEQISNISSETHTDSCHKRNKYELERRTQADNNLKHANINNPMLDKSYFDNTKFTSDYVGATHGQAEQGFSNNLAASNADNFDRQIFTQPSKKSKRIKLIRPTVAPLKSPESNDICPAETVSTENYIVQNVEPAKRWKSPGEKKFLYDSPLVNSTAFELNDSELDYDEADNEQDTTTNTNAMQNDSVVNDSNEKGNDGVYFNTQLFNVGLVPPDNLFESCSEWNVLQTSNCTVAEENLNSNQSLPCPVSDDGIKNSEIVSSEVSQKSSNVDVNRKHVEINATTDGEDTLHIHNSKDGNVSQSSMQVDDRNDKKTEHKRDNKLESKLSTSSSKNSESHHSYSKQKDRLESRNGSNRDHKSHSHTSGKSSHKLCSQYTQTDTIMGEPSTINKREIVTELRDLDDQIEVLTKRKRVLLNILYECEYEAKEKSVVTNAQQSIKNQSNISSIEDGTVKTSAASIVSTKKVKKTVGKTSTVNDKGTLKSFEKYPDWKIVKEVQSRKKKKQEEVKQQLLMKLKTPPAINDRSKSSDTNSKDQKKKSKKVAERKNVRTEKIKSYAKDHKDVVIRNSDEKIDKKKDDTGSSDVQRRCTRSRSKSFSKESVADEGSNDTVPDDPPSGTKIPEQDINSKKESVAGKKRSRSRSKSKSNDSFLSDNGNQCKNATRTKKKASKLKCEPPPEAKKQKTSFLDKSEDIPSVISDSGKANVSDRSTTENYKNDGTDLLVSINKYTEKYALKECSVILEYSSNEDILTKVNNYKNTPGNDAITEHDLKNDGNEQLRVVLDLSEETLANITKEASLLVEDNKFDMVYEGHQGSILILKLHNSTLLAGSSDGHVYLYDICTGEHLHTFIGSESISKSSTALTSMCLLKNSDKEMCLYTGGLDSKLRKYNFDTKTLLSDVYVDEPIQCMEAKWNHIFIGSSRGRLVFYSIKKSTVLVNTVKISDNNILMLRATQEGARRVLLVATRNCPVSVRDAFSGLLLRYMQFDHDDPTVYTISVQNSMVFCGTSQHGILAFNFQEGNLQSKLIVANSTGVVSIRIVKNLLFAACYNGLIYVYDTNNNENFATMKGPGGMLLSMEIFDKLIIVGTKKKILTAWKIPQTVWDRYKSCK